ncbi:MAG: tRNA-dihydrouridine synthase, partial [Amphiplicatus sp.]
GNGDVVTPEDAANLLAESGADGVMIGRGTYGRPWFIHQVEHYLKTGVHLPDPPLHEQKSIMLTHYNDMMSHYGIEAGVRIARKHISWYSKGLPNSAEFRAAVMQAADPNRVNDLITDFFDPLIDKMAA